MTSGPITSWLIEGENMEEVTDFLFLDSKNHCGWWLQPGNQKMIASCQESYDKPRQCIKKQRQQFVTTVPIVKAMVFPILMYRSESWTTKMSEVKELMLWNGGAREDSWEFLGLQGDQTSPS